MNDSVKYMSNIFLQSCLYFFSQRTSFLLRIYFPAIKDTPYSLDGDGTGSVQSRQFAVDDVAIYKHG